MEVKKEEIRYIKEAKGKIREYINMNIENCVNYFSPITMSQSTVA